MKVPIPVIVAASIAMSLSLIGNAAQGIWIGTQVPPLREERDHFEQRYNATQKALNDRLNDEMRSMGLLPEGM